MGWLRRRAWIVIVALFLAPQLAAAEGFVQGTNGEPGRPDLIALNCGAGFDSLSSGVNFLVLPGYREGYQREEKSGMVYVHSGKDPDEYYVTLPSHPAHPAVFLYTHNRDRCVPGTHTVGCGFGDTKEFRDQLMKMPHHEMFRSCPATAF
jgi:hypothetical protein